MEQLYFTSKQISYCGFDVSTKLLTLKPASVARELTLEATKATLSYTLIRHKLAFIKNGRPPRAWEKFAR